MTASVTSRDRNTFAGVVLLLVLAFGWVLGWYWSTAHQIFSIWERSDTYAHGLVVLPVFVWLVWRKRHAIAAHHPQPTPWVVLPIAAIGFIWLVGQMVSVDGLTHFALIGMIILTFAGLLGAKLARVLLFPLLFLYFGLPVGDFLLPTLMHYTAEFTVFALRLSGIPVYQENLYFVIPTGRWSVVEACSGLRYMAASLFVGALYAYLNYVSLKRRLLFMLVALTVPIVANWIRAYLTVMIGHHFGTEFVEGFIHIVYGWVFFGVVILLMFWIGSIWREDAETVASHSASVQAAPVPALQANRLIVRILPFAVVVAAFPLLLKVIEEPVEPFVVGLTAPVAAAGWSLSDQTLHDYMPNFTGHRGELFQAYERSSDGATVGLYVAYYARQREDAEMVAWQNRLTGREGGASWLQMSTSRQTMPVVGRVNRGLIRSRTDTRLAVWHWYWTNQRVIASDVMAKAILALDHLTGQQDDAAFIAVYAPYVLAPDEVHPLVEAFIREHDQAIEAMLMAVETDR